MIESTSSKYILGITNYDVTNALLILPAVRIIHPMNMARTPSKERLYLEKFKEF